MWERYVLLTDGQVVFPGFSGFRPSLMKSGSIQVKYIWKGRKTQIKKLIKYVYSQTEMTLVNLHICSMLVLTFYVYRFCKISCALLSIFVQPARVLNKWCNSFYGIFSMPQHLYLCPRRGNIVFRFSVRAYVPGSILYKSTSGRYRPVRVADGPITARYRLIKNASWGGYVRMYVLLYECVYIRTYVRDPVRLRLRHLYQVEFCSFIVRYREHQCTVYTLLVLVLSLFQITLLRVKGKGYTFKGENLVIIDLSPF